jgi:hypothetical protein
LVLGSLIFDNNNTKVAVGTNSLLSLTVIHQYS